MAIIIPSKNIYNYSYTPVVNNDIKKIEVSINNLREEIDNNNQVLNTSFEIENQFETTGEETVDTEIEVPDFEYNYDILNGELAIAGIAAKSYRFTTKIPSETSSYILNNEFVSASIKKKIEKIKTTAKVGIYVETRDYVRVGKLNVNYSNSTKDISYDTLNLPTFLTSTYGGTSVTKTITNPESNLSQIRLGEVDSDGNYTVSIDIYAASRTFKFAGEIVNTNVETEYSCDITEYRPISIDVTINGKTYTLQEETEVLIIPSEIEDKSFSISSNKFMQSAYKGQIESELNKIVKTYNKGKQTAKILCSIGEYYDSDGKKVISTLTSEKMSFNLYDEVVPMVKNSLGFDEPMSLNDDGNYNIFSVLGSKIYFDGAVWQELSLQEVGILQLGQLSTPYIEIVDNILTITATSGAMSFDIYVDNGVFVKNVTESAVDMWQLGLSKGSYRIYVIAKGMGYANSDPSNNIEYTTQLTPPNIKINENILTIFDNSGIATSFNVYSDDNMILNTLEKNVDLLNTTLESGSHIITVTANAEGYLESPRSQPITYIPKDKLTAPKISIEDNTLTIEDESELARAFDILINGEVNITISADAQTTYQTETNDKGGQTYIISSNNYKATNGTYIIGV
jgi:hypothetical protein